MVERERYELTAGAAYHFASGRREFLQLLGGGLAVFLVVTANADAQESGARRRPPGETMPREISAWLHVAQDGSVTVFTGKTEVGQNIRTSLTQAVAEELHCAPSTVQLVMADTDLTPFDMGTFGSRTTPYMAPQLRKVAASARETLIEMAAARLAVDRTLLQASNGSVRNTQTNASLTYAELTHGQQIERSIDANTALSAPANWKIAGQSLEKIGARDIVTGRHRYTSDIVRPGMLFGKVLRPAGYGATLESLHSPQDATGLVRDGEFVGVVAADEFAAEKALQSLEAKWKSAPQPSSRELFAYLKANTEPSAAGDTTERGSVEATLATAGHKLESSYTVSYIAHTPLEPRAAVAEWTAGRLTVWTGTQRPFGVRGELAQAFGIPETQIRVIVPDTGSGYGGKHTGECAIEAARLAKAAGKPVKLLWTREEEFTWAYFRPAGVIDIRSAATPEGALTAWDYQNYNSGSSGIDNPYHTPNQRIQFHAAKSPLRQGSYRGLAATANHFARESHIDELAHNIGMDPLQFRLRNLADPRMKAVLNAACDRFRQKPSPARPGRGSGIACGFEKGGYVACCADVSTDAGKVRLERIVIAFECGAIVNPKHLENQVQGAAVMAIGGALFESVEFENGRLLNGRLSRYRVPRFSDLPVIETVLLNRPDLPSAGAGETPIVGLAPAVGNAIFRATGVRVRSLPLLPALASLLKDPAVDRSALLQQLD